MKKLKTGEKVSTSIVLDLDMIKEFDKIALSSDRSRSSVIRGILLQYFKDIKAAAEK